MMIKKVDHIAVLVPDLEEAKSFWVDALGLELERVDSVPEEAVDIAFLPVGESEIELLQPTDPESSVAKYLAKRGAGMHHICFEVEDIESALDRLRAVNVPLITETAKVGKEGKKYAFVHPKGTGGVLVELYELP
jgi:methylmalonyl-CoA/ethylmalonyl-CoA epimerase